MFARLKTKNIPHRPELLFDYQLLTLGKRSCPLGIIQAFKEARKKVLAHAGSITMAEDRIPFLPVITQCYLGYHGLTGLLRHNNQDGVVECEVERIKDLEETPRGLYYIFDVEGGENLKGYAPEIAHTLIVQNKRLSAVTAEILSLALHTGALTANSLYAVGSRYASDRTPMIWLNVVMSEADRSWMSLANPAEESASLYKSELGKPALGWWYADSPMLGGAPSCASRLEI